MAATLKRKRATRVVSYRDPSSDVDVVESDSETHSRIKSATSARRSKRQESPSAEEEPSFTRQRSRANAHAEGTTNTTKGRRAPRREKRTVSYRDASSDDDDDDDFEIEEVEKQPKTRKSAAPSRRDQNVRPSRKRTVRSVGARLQKSLGAPLKPRTTQQSMSNSTKIPTDGHKPDWASLPYQVLLQVFVYASHPLHNENLSPLPSILWLVKAATICKAFAEPALTALYRNPPIYAMQHHRRQLVEHLVTPPADAYVDYQVMVKRLDLDVTRIAYPTDPLFANAASLSNLIAALTALKEIDIFDPLDRPPYRPRQLRRRRRWQYSDEIFAALRQSTRLRSWRWIGLFCGQEPGWMKEIHEDRAFQSLRELTLTKFDSGAKRNPEDPTPKTEESLASALGALPNLTSLAFESCKVVNGQLLPLLPSELVSLNITNCINVASGDLKAFLADRGQKLEELVLNHNQCLDISFLVDLKRSCPRLEVLKMDLNYYSSLFMTSNNEPLYDWLLGIDEIPTWPSTLRILDMEYLRHWSSDAATNFFASLVDSAKELPWLREIRISAMVDLGWRQRADYRRKWESRFDHVFASRSPAPSAHLVSLRAYREWMASEKGTEKHDSFLEMSEEVDKVQTTKEDVTQDEVSESDSDAPLLPRHQQKHGDRWNSRRLRSRGKASANYDESSQFDPGTDDMPNVEEEPAYIQGRCHTVVFRIDNLRPREEVFDEGDFLDEELSGDEDWNGNDDVEDGYAW